MANEHYMHAARDTETDYLKCVCNNKHSLDHIKFCAFSKHA